MLNHMDIFKCVIGKVNSKFVSLTFSENRTTEPFCPSANVVL